MTIEQKAKAYDEAISLIKDYNRDEEGFICVKPENIFPELKESEDERIRKELLEHCINRRDGKQVCVDASDYRRWADWLEKQSNKNIQVTLPTFTFEDVLALECSMKTAKITKGGDKLYEMLVRLYDKIHNAYLLEKQGEKKPADRVEPKFKVKYAGSEYNVFETKNIAGVPFYGIEDEPNHIDYVQAENCEIINGGYGIKEGGFSIPTKPAMFSEQKSADKVEDEEYNGEDYGIDGLYHAQEILEKTLGRVDGYQSDDGILEHKCAITAVKKLYKQNPAWSEEDSYMLESIVSDFAAGHKSSIGQDKWLKSLKPQNHWKPTEEQMKALHDLNLTGNISYAGQGQVLIELYNDLKKL